MDISSKNNFMQQKHNLQKKKIMFVFPCLEGGGAERVITNIIRHLDNRLYDISLILFETKGPYLSSIPDYVNLYDLKKKRSGFFSVLKIIFSLIIIFRKVRPNTIISFINMTSVITIISRHLSFIKCKLIIGIRIYFHSELIKTFNKLNLFLYKRLLKYANCFIVNSVELGKYSAQFFHINPNKIKVIYNPIDFENINKLKNEHLDGLSSGQYILAVGRLSNEKGFSYLLKAFFLIREKIHENLVILGKGPDEKILKGMASDLGIQERVLFLGFQSNPYKFMRNASIFVLSSLYEGFPNVLLEAMACGAPVISTNCTSGPGEIIENYKNGILVPPADEKALAGALFNLLTNIYLRTKFSETGRKRVEDFRIEKILLLYEELFH